jgi:CCR4-NOT transcription complex subunit 1
MVWYQVDLLPEISQAPHILYDLEPALKNKQLKAEVDEYLKVRALILAS